MTRRLGLIVTDASPLITLAAAGALACLTMPGLPVIIPDDPDIEALLFFADNDVRKRNFVRALPERVMALST